MILCWSSSCLRPDSLGCCRTSVTPGCCGVSCGSVLMGCSTCARWAAVVVVVGGSGSVLTACLGRFSGPDGGLVPVPCGGDPCRRRRNLGPPTRRERLKSMSLVLPRSLSVLVSETLAPYWPASSTGNAAVASPSA